MGFTTGFLSGITLTSSILYLSLMHHHRTRTTQSHLLRSQTSLLTNLTQPTPSKTPSSIDDATQSSPEILYDRTTETRWVRNAGLVETAKDLWNDEVEKGVRWVEGVKWGELVARGVGEGVRRIRGESEEK